MSAAVLTFICSHKNFQELDIDNHLRILRKKFVFNQSTNLIKIDKKNNEKSMVISRMYDETHSRFVEIN